MCSSTPLVYCTSFKELSVEAAVAILNNTEDVDKIISKTPPTKPKGGEVFPYSSKGNDKLKGM